MDNWDCSTSDVDKNSDGDTSTGSGDRDVSQIEVKSLHDVFDNANTIGELFGLIRYNPWVCVIWFHWW